jgi:carboxyl-terminal processing protease
MTSDRACGRPAARVTRTLGWLAVVAVGLGAGASFVVGLGVGSGVFGSGMGVARGGRDEQVYWEAWDRVERHFYGSMPAEEQRAQGAIASVLGLLDDPYSQWTVNGASPNEAALGCAGLGITVRRRPDGELGLSPHPGSPAQQAGVSAGDLLLAVDGRPVVSSMSVEVVQEWLRGENGTSVVLTVRGTVAGTPAPMEVELVREDAQGRRVISRVLDIESGVGYLRIECLDQYTEATARTALVDLERQGVARVVLDVRGVRDGSLDAVVELAGLWLGEDVALYEVSHQGVEQVISAEPQGIVLEMPLAVVVDGQTAGPAEVLAGCLQDNGRALLVGEHTAGEGSVQEDFILSDGSSLRLTTTVWLTPARHRIDGHGVAPDMLVHEEAGEQDRQVDCAVQYLTSLPDETSEDGGQWGF